MDMGDGAMPSLGDFPSLRDLETSNMFSAINHNMGIKRYMDPRRKEILENMNQQLEDSGKGCLTFKEISRGDSKMEVAEKFMSLMIFA